MYADKRLYAYLVPVLEGIGAAADTGKKAKEFGITKALIVHDKTLKEIGMVDKITASLDASEVNWVCFDGVLPDPPDTVCEEGARFGIAEKVDGIIALGGGSAIDTAKAIDICLTNGFPLSEHYRKTAGLNPGVPCIFIPTTAGTGSEVTSMSVISSEGGNGPKTIVYPVLTKRIAIVDAECMVGMPQALAASTGMDALSHACESITSSINNPVAESMGAEAIRLISKWLPLAVLDTSNITAAERVGHASLLAGISFTNACTQLGHSIAHVVGHEFHIPHGIGCALVLGPEMEFSARFVPDKVRLVGECFGLDIPEGISNELLGSYVASAINAFRIRIGIPSLKELNVDYETLISLVDKVFADSSQLFAPGRPTNEDVLEILKKIH